eukprot:COSAG01_NODE_860_length_13064_cov_23.466949_11_plen_72_part_00
MSPRTTFSGSMKCSALAMLKTFCRAVPQQVSSCSAEVAQHAKAAAAPPSGAQSSRDRRSLQLLSVVAEPNC